MDFIFSLLFYGFSSALFGDQKAQTTGKVPKSSEVLQFVIMEDIEHESMQYSERLNNRTFQHGRHSQGETNEF